MDLPNLKQLQKLAQACRKAGIRTFKGYGFEFTLDDAPTKAPRAAAKGAHNFPDTAFESDSPTPEELLFWSAAGIPESNPEDEQS